MKKYRLEVPADAAKKLGLDKTDYSMWISHRQVVVRPSNVSDMVPQINSGGMASWPSFPQSSSSLRLVSGGCA